MAYVEDLMDEQVHRGHEVAYFFSGRQYPLARGPRLRRWEHRGVAMFEVINSPLYDHGRQPSLEVDEPGTERLLRRVIRELRPAIVHVQELAGLPSSVLEVARLEGVPVVVTLQDYFPLCSTFKLFDAHGQVCLRREIGADCVASTVADDRRSGVMIEATVGYYLARMSTLERMDEATRARWIRKIARLSGDLEASRRRLGQAQPSRPAAFQRRREINVARLSRAGCVIAMSRRVAEIYVQLGVEPSRLRTLQLTLGHIERLQPHRRADGAPLTFATLAGFESSAKGAHVLIEAMRSLSELGRQQRFRLLVFGHVRASFAKEAAGLPGLEIRGEYWPDELDALLDEVDVGIMPSIWEEAYGYAGVEFLAKGVPVIANAIGGMTDYTREGETGWLNRSCSGGELARIMASLIEHPDRVTKLRTRIIANRASILKPLSEHAAEMEKLYRDLDAEPAT